MMPGSGSVDQLTQENGSSTRSVSVRINLQAIRHNLTVARQLSGGSKLFATIKADAYGHGAKAVARALSAHTSSVQSESASTFAADGDADGFAVVTLDEALELRQAGIKQPVLVLQGPQTRDACDDMKRHGLWPVIHDAEQYQWYRRHPARGELRAWLKADTGMGRLGFRPEEAQAIVDAADGISWMGLMTHFACADEPDNPFTHQQCERLDAIESPAAMVRSLANSAAILAWPETRADWARPGIMLYGCNPLDRELPPEIVLKPAMSVTAPLISVKRMRAGEGVGYAQTWQCPVDMPVGFVALGYRDGLPRVLDDAASVTVSGNRCPIVGRVSMDSIAIDLRSVPDAKTGDIAEFWGPSTPIDLLARAAGTINYELLTSIRGSRIYDPLI